MKKKEEGKLSYHCISEMNILRIEKSKKFHLAWRRQKGWKHGGVLAGCSLQKNDKFCPSALKDIIHTIYT